MAEERSAVILDPNPMVAPDHRVFYALIRVVLKAPENSVFGVGAFKVLKILHYSVQKVTNRLEDFIGGFEVRDVPALGDDFAGHGTADMAGDGGNLCVTAKLVVITLQDQGGAGDGGKFVNHLPVAKGRLAPGIDPGAKNGVGLVKMVPFKPRFPV